MCDTINEHSTIISNVNNQLILAKQIAELTFGRVDTLVKETTMLTTGLKLRESFEAEHTLQITELILRIKKLEDNCEVERVGFRHVEAVVWHQKELLECESKCSVENTIATQKVAKDLVKTNENIKEIEKYLTGDVEAQLDKLTIGLNEVTKYVNNFSGTFDRLNDVIQMMLAERGFKKPKSTSTPPLEKKEEVVIVNSQPVPKKEYAPSVMVTTTTFEEMDKIGEMNVLEFLKERGGFTDDDLTKYPPKAVKSYDNVVDTPVKDVLASHSIKLMKHWFRISKKSKDQVAIAAPIYNCLSSFK